MAFRKRAVGYSCGLHKRFTSKWRNSIVGTKESAKGIVTDTVYQFTFCFFLWPQINAILNNTDQSYLSDFAFTALLSYSDYKYDLQKILVKHMNHGTHVI